MKRLAGITLATLGLLLTATTGPAWGQYYPNPQYGLNRPRGPVPGAGPRLSPFLNLRRGANTPALNYYLGTLPEIDRRNFQDVTREGFARVEEQLAGSAPGGEDVDLLPRRSITGHGVEFMSAAPYFSTVGTTPRGGVPPAAGATGTAAPASGARRPTTPSAPGAGTRR